jgi:salicylate hydroxylase
MADSPFLIVGGGIAGLAASLGLAKFGLPSHILEKTPFFEQIGAGIQLGPNAVSALQYLGAWDAVAPHCVSPEEIHARDGISGKLLQRVILGKNFENRFGAPYRVAHRADLQNGLLASARADSNIAVQNNAEVHDVSIERTALELASGPTLKGQAIIAADGVHSVIRQKIFPKAKPNNTGHTLFRRLVPISAVPSSVEARVVTLWLYPGGHVVHYAVSQGKQFNIVASIEEHGATPAAAFKNACAPLAGLLQAPGNWLEWPAYDLTPNPNWTKNNIVLIGDAAHASLPYLAQGAAMALEDACALADAVHSAGDSLAAFEMFSVDRFSRTRALAEKSRQLGKIYHAKNYLRDARNFTLCAIPSSSFLRQLAWIYNWQPNGK